MLFAGSSSPWTDPEVQDTMMLLNSGNYLPINMA
jgi:hypothetical protein